MHDNLPRLVPQWARCGGFANRPQASKLASALRALSRDHECRLLSVESDFELAEKLAGVRARVVVFAMLRDPLLHLVSGWRHDIGKRKFASVDGKYASAARNGSSGAGDLGVRDVLGFARNLQTNRLGAGHVALAKRRVRAIEFGLTEHFHASICVLLFSLGQRALFDDGCTQACARSPLSDTQLYPSSELAPPDTALLNVTLECLTDAYRRQADDRLLHAYAHELFVERVRYVERSTGARLLCATT